MKTKMHVMRGLVLGLVFLTIPLMLAAQRGAGRQNADGPKRDRTERMGMNPMDRLPDLTDQQKEDIQKIHLATRKDMLPLQNKLGEKMARLKTLNTAEKADMKAINATLDEVYALKGDMAKRRAQAMQDIRKLLNEEQRLIFDSHAGGGRGDQEAFGKRRNW